jgi:hypothetical protein
MGLQHPARLAGQAAESVPDNGIRRSLECHEREIELQRLANGVRTDDNR